jgi:hypothetical protein
MEGRSRAPGVLDRFDRNLDLQRRHRSVCKEKHDVPCHSGNVRSQRWVHTVGYRDRIRRGFKIFSSLRQVSAITGKVISRLAAKHLST